MVNFGNALGELAASFTDDVPVRSKSWVVDSYNEVNLKLTVLQDNLSRALALMFMYHTVEAMQKMDKWLDGFWVIIQGAFILARLDVSDGTSNRVMCDPPFMGMTAAKRSILDASSRITNTHQKGGDVSLSTTTLVNASNNDSLGITDISLNCTWSGKNLGYLTAFMSPLYITAFQPLRNPDPYRTAWSEHTVSVEPWDVTFIFSAFDIHRPTSPAWTYNLIIKALGQLPLAYADKTPYWDFREISAIINLDGVPTGIVKMLKSLQS